MKTLRPTSYALLLGVALVAGSAAEAKETARVLPKGISRLRAVGVVTTEGVKHTYNGNGEVELISSSLNRSITIHDIANAAGGEQGEQLKALVQGLNAVSPGAGDQLAGADLNSQFSTEAQIYLAAYEYGATERLSLGVRMPIVKRTVTNRFSANSVNNAAAMRASIGGLSAAAAAGLDSLSQKSFNTSFFEGSLFTSKGYEAPRDYTSTDQGDLEFGGKYNFYKTEAAVSSFLIGARAPTGKQPSMTNPFDKGTSKGSWASAAQYLQEFYAGRVTFGGAAKYTYNFKDTRDRAVPRDANDSLPSLLPENGQVTAVERKQGNQLETELSTGYRFKGDAFGVWSAWQYIDKGTDKFSGSKSNLYYDGLAKGTGFNQHMAEVGVEYSTIPAFRSKKFAVPLEVSLLYNTPFAGKNSVVNAYTRLDVMVYF